MFDGKTLTLSARTRIVYTQVDIPGSIDHLVDELRDKYERPVPGADLLLSNVYDELMRDVTDVKDLGSGVIGGTECDHLAFRNKDVDWQIWIAQGDKPYPCRFVITSKMIALGPQYSIEVRNWKTGTDVASSDFSFKAPADAKKVDVRDPKNIGHGRIAEQFRNGRNPMTIAIKIGFLLLFGHGLVWWARTGRRTANPRREHFVLHCQAEVGRPLTPVSVAGGRGVRHAADRPGLISGASGS